MTRSEERRQKRRKLFRQRMPLYRRDISLFAREVIGFCPDAWLEEVFRDVVAHNRISVKSGQGVGKTSGEAIIILWFLTCFPNARVVATAPTLRQLHDVLWSEIAKWMKKSPLLPRLLKWTKSYLYMMGYEKQWYATARTATKPENMQGFHEDNMLFVVDEASGIAEPIMEAILGTLSGPNNKLLLCGNPTKTAGTFYDSHHRDRVMYRCHTINAEDSPRTNKDNIASLIRKYGKESNVVRVRVYGQFPKQEDDVFIPTDIVEHATKYVELEGPVSRITLGVDVARYGNDETVIARNVSGRITLPQKYRGQNLMWTVGKIIQQYHKTIDEFPAYKGRIYVVIDDTGLGGGVTDRLEEIQREGKLPRIEIVPINFGAKPPTEDGQKYFNDIATFLWAGLRDQLDAKQVQLENDSDLVAQLTVRKYAMTSHGKIALESKKDMKKRLGEQNSPDRADAVTLSTYVPAIFDITSLIS